MHDAGRGQSANKCAKGGDVPRHYHTRKIRARCRKAKDTEKWNNYHKLIINKIIKKIENK